MLMTRREPAFLPLAVSAARAAANVSAAPAQLGQAQALRQRAEAADEAAANCWTALLAGCDAPTLRVLMFRLHDLTEATSAYVGGQCWFGANSPHRPRVTEAEARATQAIRDGDGEDFVEALVDYDQAVATAVASVRARTTFGTPDEPSRINSA